MKQFPECRKPVNTFVNTPIRDSQTFNIIVNPTDIDNIIERVPPANLIMLITLIPVEKPIYWQVSHDNNYLRYLRTSNMGIIFK